MTISNIELLQIGKDYNIPNFQVKMNDEMPNEPFKKNSYYIINLEDLKDDGSHWVCVIVDKNGKTLYFDSFGCVPSLQVEEFLHKSKHKYVYSNRIIQDLKSVQCGLFCMGIIIHVYSKPKMSMYESANEFINFFDFKNYKKNDKIIKDLFN